MVRLIFLLLIISLISMQVATLGTLYEIEELVSKTTALKKEIYQNDVTVKLSTSEILEKPVLVEKPTKDVVISATSEAKEVPKENEKEDNELTLSDLEKISDDKFYNICDSDIKQYEQLFSEIMLHKYSEEDSKRVKDIVECIFTKSRTFSNLEDDKINNLISLNVENNELMIDFLNYFNRSPYNVIESGVWDQIKSQSDVLFERSNQIISYLKDIEEDNKKYEKEKAIKEFEKDKTSYELCEIDPTNEICKEDDNQSFMINKAYN